MQDSKIVEEFERTWAYTRGMTNQFINCVPTDKWNFSHHAKFGPLSKQFRHMVQVYSCYINAISTKKMDLSKKKEQYSGPLEKEAILNALSELDKKLKMTLDYLKVTGLDNVKIDLFGMEMGFTEFTHVMIQHECAHFGIWKNYSVFGGFETPEQWKNEWDL